MPQCGKELRKIIGTGVGVIFKGKGFYETDYGNGSFSGRTCCGRTERCDNRLVQRMELVKGNARYA